MPIIGSDKFSLSYQSFAQLTPFSSSDRMVNPIGSTASPSASISPIVDMSRVRYFGSVVFSTITSEVASFSGSCAAAPISCSSSASVAVVFVFCVSPVSDTESFASASSVSGMTLSFCIPILSAISVFVSALCPQPANTRHSARKSAPFRLFLMLSSSNCHSIASIFMTYSVVPASRRLCPEREKPWAS